MQYILTEDEFNELKSKKEHYIDLSKARLQTLCTKIANEMPIIYWNNNKANPWGCKLSDDHGDECPVKDICSSDDKAWSQ